MDTSKEYIKMCQKATEVQGQKPDLDEEEQNFIANFHNAKACPVHGEEHLWTRALAEDFYCTNCGEELVSVNHIPNIETYEENGALETVWLPRQDQLQGMIKDIPWKLQSVGTGEDNAYRFQFLTSSDYWVDFSPESVIMKGVMHEKYGKKWSGGKWKSGK